MGIYPEGPIDRLLGGTLREYEDNLPPPRLWEAKIVEFGAGAEKSVLGGGNVKQQGWDALMPVSAALPPNLYPIIYEANDHSIPASDQPPTYPPPPSNQHANLIGRHMPQFLRRHTGDGGDLGSGPTIVNSVAADPTSTTATSDLPTSLASKTGEKGEDKLAASVNITVLIAMPSSRTVFSSSRRLPSSTSNTSVRNSRMGVTPAGGKLQEVEEDRDADASSLKGKARRAPSLRSFKSTTSVKSVAEARREAFFNHIEKDDKDQDVSQCPVLPTPAPAYEDEDEELPELMFGTASVPIFSNPSGSASQGKIMSRQTSLTPASRLMQPSRSDILALVSAASRAREKKAEVTLSAKENTKKQEEVDLEANRRSVAETSLDGEGTSAIVAGWNDRSIDDDALQTPMGDVTTRMMRLHNVDQGFEMTDMTPSQRNNQTHPSDMQSPTTPTPLLSMTSPATSTAPDRPLTSANMTTTSSWHTGIEDDATAARSK